MILFLTLSVKQNPPFLKAVEVREGTAVNGVDMFIGQGIETMKKIYNLSIDYSEFRPAY